MATFKEKVNAGHGDGIRGEEIDLRKKKGRRLITAYVVYCV